MYLCEYESACTHVCVCVRVLRSPISTVNFLQVWDHNRSVISACSASPKPYHSVHLSNLPLQP